MKRVLYLGLVVLLVSLVLVVPASADSGCGMTMESTIASLTDCVNHAIDAGLITSPAVAQSLLAKLNAAQTAVTNGHNQTAINVLQAFIYSVQAQAGLHIDAQHAEHMIMHANMVIVALGG